MNECIECEVCISLEDQVIFDSERDETLRILRFILTEIEPNEKNRFQPSQSQVDFLRSQPHVVAYLQNLDLNGLHELLLDLSDSLHFGIDEKYYDFRTRALAFAQGIKNMDGNKIVLLDGHGRMMFHVLDSLKREVKIDDLNRFRIKLPELDPVVHVWHMMLYNPQFIQSVNADIFDVTRSILSDSRIGLYFNFCGANEQSDEIIDMLITRNQHVGNKHITMVSYSGRGTRKSKRSRGTYNLLGVKTKPKITDRINTLRSFRQYVMTHFSTNNMQTFLM